MIDYIECERVAHSVREILDMSGLGDGISMNFAEAIFRYLSDNRMSPDSLPDAPEPGLYAIFAGSPGCLPDIVLPQTGLVYIGQSSDLARRNHFKPKNGHSGFSSPRRNLGSILKMELSLTAEPRSAGRSETNFKNFRFAGDGEERLSEWMRRNLLCAIRPFGGDVASMEKRPIKDYEPPLNLTGWRNQQKKQIQALRDACKEEAKRVWNQLK